MKSNYLLVKSYAMVFRFAVNMVSSHSLGWSDRWMLTLCLCDVHMFPVGLTGVRT